MTTKDFEKSIAILMEAILFKKKKYIFVKQIDKNIFATSGFGVVSQQNHGSLFVHPTIGIHNKSVDNLFRQLMDQKVNSFFQPIISTSIGYLMPQNDYIEWTVNDDNLDKVNPELIGVIKTYGLPFIERYQNPDELLKCVENQKYILSENRDYKLPILYYLNGKKLKGLQYIEECIEGRKVPISDEEIKRLSISDSGETIIIRAGENNSNGRNIEDFGKKISSGDSIVVVGSGYSGKVSPAYLKYYNNFKALK